MHNSIVLGCFWTLLSCLQLALSVLSLLGLARVRMQPCCRSSRRPVLIFFLDHLDRFFFRRPPGPPKGAPPVSSSLSAESGLSSARRLWWKFNGMDRIAILLKLAQKFDYDYV